MPEQKKLQMDVVYAILVLVVVAGLYYWFSAHQMVPLAPVQNQVATKANLIVSNSLNSASGVRGVPPGFPASIPVETANIKESYSATYQNPKLTQYTVSYTSTKTVATLWNTYNTYMKSSGYTLNTKLTSAARGTLSGVHDKTTLAVVIANQKTGSLVTVTLSR